MSFVTFFIIGTMFGSFISMLSYRLPRDLNIVKPRSACVNCDHKLGFLDLIPILSWIKNLGLCAYCHKKISIRYPLIEFFTGLIFFSISSLIEDRLEMILLLYLSVIFITMIVTDLENFIIPDILQIAFLFFAIAWAWCFSIPYLQFFLNSFFGFIFSYFLAKIFLYLTNKDSLGFGDIKFIAIASSFLGLENLVMFFLFSGIFGIVTGFLWYKFTASKIFPFAPSLILSLSLCLILPYLFVTAWEYDSSILEMILEYFLKTL